VSPSESDLRAALHADEPEGSGAVNADDIIWAVKGRQARRRHLAMSVAAAVVVVGGIAGGLAALVATNPGESAGGAGGADVFNAANGAASAPQLGVASSSAAGRAPAATSVHGGAGSTRSVAVKCSPKPEQIALPGGGSPGQFGASSPLLSKSPASYGICVYSTTLGTSSQVHRDKPESVVVTGVAAEQLTTSLQNASPTPQSVACPLIRTTRQVTIVMTPITADGTALKPITASTSVPACNTQITNGTAVRYNWQVPSRLQRELNLTVVGSRSNDDPIDLVPGKVVSSPHTVGASPVK
jgi:hypothetical protein